MSMYNLLLISVACQNNIVCTKKYSLSLMDKLISSWELYKHNDYDNTNTDDTTITPTLPNHQSISLHIQTLSIIHYNKHMKKSTFTTSKEKDYDLLENRVKNDLRTHYDIILIFFKR